MDRGLAWLTAVVVLAVASLAPLGAQPAAAQKPVTPDDVNRVAHQLYCPVCESIPLDVCTTKACADWRELIRTKLSNGETDQQILDYFAATYGDRVMVQPPQHGFNWLIYVVPPIVLIGVALLAWRVLGGLVRPAAAPAAAAPAAAEAEPEDEYVARLERQVREAEKD